MLHPVVCIVACSFVMCGEKSDPKSNFRNQDTSLIGKHCINYQISQLSNSDILLALKKGP